MSDPKRYDACANDSKDGMGESLYGEWVKWGDYHSMRKHLLIENASWIGISGEKSARIKELEAEVAKLKEDRKLLAKSIEAILPVSLDKFSDAVLNNKGKKKHG